MTAQLRVLMIEDSETDMKLVAAELRRLGRPLEMDRVEDAEGLAKRLDRRWDVVLCDWSMPKLNALAALDLVRRSGSDVPFIIVSGTIGEDLAVAAMRAGAADFILKDKLGRLVPAIERELREREHRGARRVSDAKNAAFLETALDAIVGMDHQGNIEEWNPAAERTFGHLRAEVLGRKLAEVLIPESLRDRHRSGLERLLSSGQSALLGRRIEVVALHRDGRELPVELAVARVGNASPPSFLGFLRDISEKKRAEQTRNALEEQLRQSTKMDAVGRLAGGVAHDFNNLLSVIMTYSELALEDLPPGESMRDDINEIRNAAKRAADLTHRLLLFSRHKAVAPVALDVNAVLEQMERMLRRIIGEDIDLTCTLGSNLSRVMIDPSGLEQIVMNLVVNARDAMPRGGQLTIETHDAHLDDDFARAHLGVAPGRYVMLVVADTGVGMERDVQARMFDPFFTTKGPGKGTGLGLSTVFGIVRQAEGSVWVYSEPNRGTTIKVYLPAIEAMTPGQRMSSRAAPATLDGNETILLVEDDAQVRAVAKAILRRRGYVVIQARDSNEALALEASHEGPLHFLLTDVVMPQTSGPELAARLLERRPGLRVLFMSGYTDESVVRHGVLRTGAPYLQKPFTPESLARKVRETLDQPVDFET